MAFEKITLDVNANGIMQTFHSKQYDVGRPIIIDLVAGEDAYTPAAGITFELHCRKVDFNLVVLTDYEIDENEITFATTEQLTACVGDNLATLKLFKDELEIATMNFILNVTIDPDAQGIISESEIDNLTTQIEEITEQVIGDNYYDKTETDALLDLKADAADVYTKTQVDTALALKADKSDTYTKAQVDSALSAKANTADLATVATTGDYDDLINKPNIPAAQVQSDYAQSDNTQVDYIKNKPDISGMINAAILAVMPVNTETGSTATFTSPYATPLVNVSCDIVASGGGGTPASPVSIVGYSQANITANGDTVTITFGQTVYIGVLDVTRGKLTVTHSLLEKTVASMNNGEDYPGWSSSGIKALIGEGLNGTETDQKLNIGTEFSVNTTGIYDILYLRKQTYGLTQSQWIANYPDLAVQIAVPLVTPVEIDLTPVQISAIVGENNVSCDTNGNTTVQYKDSIQHYIDTRV